MWGGQDCHASLAMTVKKWLAMTIGKGLAMTIKKGLAMTERVILRWYEEYKKGYSCA